MAVPSNILMQAVGLKHSGHNGHSQVWVREALFSVARKLRDNEAVLQFALQTFRMLQRMGIGVVPNHYYWPVPDIASLNAQRWPTSSSPMGIDLHLDEQVNFLRRVVPLYLDECNFPEEEDGSGRYHYNNGFFESVDAEVAYSFVRSIRPSRIIEVGGGYTSRILASALESNYHETGQEGELITVDPFLERGASNSYDRAMVLRQPVQNVNLELFRSLDDGDILFLDSSHVVAIGSDVVKEYLEMLPCLRHGVLVHVHDIFLPQDYPREFIYRNLCFWSEQYLLQAFLMFNAEYEILWTGSAMALNHRDVLDEVFARWTTSYRNMPREKSRFVPTLDGERVWPSSLWMRRK